MAFTGKQIAWRLLIVIVVMAAIGAALGYYGNRLGISSAMQTGIRTVALVVLIVSLGLWQNRRSAPPTL